MSDRCVRCGKAALVRREFKLGAAPDTAPALHPVCMACAEQLDGTGDLGRPAFNAFWKVGAMGGGITVLAIVAAIGIFGVGVYFIFGVLLSGRH